MTAEDHTTLRLEDTEGPSARATVAGIRWTLPGGRTQHNRLERQRVTLGRGESEDIRLEASGVSRSHAELMRQGPLYAIHDLGSTNGTHVNGHRIEHTALSPGDVVRLGDAVGIVVRTPLEHADGPGVHGMPDDLVFGPGMIDVLETLRRIAPTTLPVVIEGETGAGKECIARTLHRLSQRSGAFQAVNCAALPPNLAEAELFGHRQGAFTGAEQAGLGHFRSAHTGTLFLDELAELPLAVQAKLLRAIQEGEVTPLGETKGRPVDVRFVAAVQRPIPELIGSDALREDLAMRLRGAVLRIPPLRKRREDIPIHFQAFLTRHSGGRAPAVESRLLEALCCYEWPGNVRELELVTRQLLALHGHEPSLRRGMLPEEIRPALPTAENSPAPREPRTREEHDLERLSLALKANGGNLSRAAAEAGVSRQRAYRLLEKRKGSDQVALNHAPDDGDAEDEGLG